MKHLHFFELSVMQQLPLKLQKWNNARNTNLE